MYASNDVDLVILRRQPEPADLPAPRLAVDPLASPENFKGQAYIALRNAIAAMDIYRSREISGSTRGASPRISASAAPRCARRWRSLSARALCARCRAAASTWCARPDARSIELITAWAALESMAARLITENAAKQEIAALRRMFATFEDGAVRAHLDEYSEVNIEFHQTIIRMSAQFGADRSRRESVHPYADDPPQDHRRKGSRRPLDSRSHAHHRST